MKKRPIFAPWPMLLALLSLVSASVWAGNPGSCDLNNGIDNDAEQDGGSIAGGIDAWAASRTR